MKVLLLGPNYFNYVSSIARALKKLNVTVVTIQYYNDVYQECNHLQKKLDQLGVTNWKAARLREWNEHISKTARDFKPDVCIVCNGMILTTQTLQNIKQGNAELVLWLLDGLRRNAVFENNLKLYDQCFVYDQQDVAYVTQKYDIPCTHLVSSYDPAIYYPKQNNRDIDICFIGKTTPKRLEILKAVAEYAKAKNRSFVTYGNYWSTRHYWKKYLFKRRYGPLASFVVNTMISPENLADLYRRSKICLNIHIAEHDGLNPRTFEILGTRSFALVDDKPELSQHFEMGKHLATYCNKNDLLEKIDYYLENTDIREKIMEDGYLYVRDKYDINTTVNRVWNIIKAI
ncbi:CgeB family protein [Sporomusa acidovorans]|uniref:Spore protein YkvP/CgeB glycosyl transferase-like domain-containing protein n=1 Tax=Sporomusa acidovorans (strain ATCC 49682 / DSM 3132 / Mol) TaxID=1123286 RepID=A0ABZ3J8C3_SPOA4|nr:glycosyltransferase [Sporomusa acidovorans]OZC19369.1 spore protein YkvP [Sporomusa acidovorans DSM 3132]SDD79184.1 spore maturation protein CgeB [Sporomusa acidovorans]